MNKILETLEAEREELADWRHDFHMHPELGLEETRTAGIVAQKLRSWGIEVTEHVGVTGVVGVINGDLGPGRSIGLRCDMDALPITECSSQSWKATVKGKCMPAVMTATRRCFWLPRVTFRSIGTFAAASYWCSSRPKKARAAPWP